MKQVYEIFPLEMKDGLLDCFDGGVTIVTEERYYVDEIAQLYKEKYGTVSVSEFEMKEGHFSECEGGDYIVIAYNDIWKKKERI